MRADARRGDLVQRLVALGFDDERLEAKTRPVRASHGARDLPDNFGNPFHNVQIHPSFEARRPLLHPSVVGTASLGSVLLEVSRIANLDPARSAVGRCLPALGA